jgi:hypothetical protein
LLRQASYVVEDVLAAPPGIERGPEQDLDLGYRHGKSATT